MSDMSTEDEVDGAFDADDQRKITEAVHGIAQNRAVIEEAKGMLMAVYDVDDEKAFELLKWRSGTCNVKLRHLAPVVIQDVTAALHNIRADVRTEVDKLFLTAHERTSQTQGLLPNTLC